MKTFTKFFNESKFMLTLLIVGSITWSNSSFAQARKMPVSVHFSVKVDTSKIRVYNLHPKDESEAVKSVFLK